MKQIYLVTNDDGTQQEVDSLDNLFDKLKAIVIGTVRMDIEATIRIHDKASGIVAEYKVNDAGEENEEGDPKFD